MTAGGKHDVAQWQASRREESAAETRAGRGKRTLGLISVCLGFFVIQLDVTIVNVALPAIQREVGGTVGGLQWIIDAYTLALASVMLTAGSRSDRVGARRVFTLGLVVFGAGSAACAAAPSLGVLIAARAVQGLGASALLPCSLALIVHQYPGPGSAPARSASGAASARSASRSARWPAAPWWQRPDGAGSSSSTSRSAR